jgi:polysaccharide export outer membrane protein
MKNLSKLYVLALGILILLQSCVSKKDIYYLQDISEQSVFNILPNNYLIQPNDILKIDIGALNPDAVLPFNKFSRIYNQPTQNIEIMKLEGYLVSANKTIQFPLLGEISVSEKSVSDLELDLKNILEKDGYLINPTVSVRLLNAKFTILGEVSKPGTITYTEKNISLLQALGIAGGLTINADREDVILIRETNGKRITTHINLLKSAWLNSPYQNIQPNDVLVVNPNDSKVKSAGYIGDLSGILGIASILLTSIVLIFN